MIIGGKELYEKLKRLSDLQMKSVMRKAAETSRAVIIPLVTVGTGELRRSIHTDAVQLDRGTTQGVVYTNKEYAPYVEFGTGPVGEKSSKVDISPEAFPLSYRQTPWRYQDENGQWHTTKGQPPRPYMYPGFRNSEKAVIRSIGRDVEKMIEENI